MKRRQNTEDSTVEGYILDVSPTKTGASGVSYFDGHVQTKHDVMRFISFCPERQTSMETAKQMKSPVKINQATITPKHGKNELVIGKYATVQVVNNLNFTRLEQVPKPQTRHYKVDEVTTRHQMFNITAKVIKVGPKVNTMTKYGEKVIQTVTVADDTATKELAMWGTKNEVTLKTTYNITNLRCNMYKQNLQFTTTSETTFEQTEDITIDEQVEQDVNEQKYIHAATVLSSITISRHNCQQCSKVIKAAEDELNDTQFKIRCSHCQAKQKVANLKKSRHCKLQIKDIDTVSKITVPELCFSSFINENDLNDKTDEQIDDFLLDVTNLSIMLENNIVTEMKIV